MHVSSPPPPPARVRACTGGVFFCYGQHNGGRFTAPTPQMCCHQTGNVLLSCFPFCVSRVGGSSWQACHAQWPASMRERGSAWRLGPKRLGSKPLHEATACTHSCLSFPGPPLYLKRQWFGVDVGSSSPRPGLPAVWRVMKHCLWSRCDCVFAYIYVLQLGRESGWWLCPASPPLGVDMRLTVTACALSMTLCV